MDGQAAIEDNLQALKRIVSGLVGMAGLIGQSPPLRGSEGRARQAARPGECPAGQRGVGAESASGVEIVSTSPGAGPAASGSSRPLDAFRHATGMPDPGRCLPRHLRLAILRLLRPAEAAARRLIIAAARGLAVVLPPPRQRPARIPMVPHALLRRFGIAVVLSAAGNAAARRPATIRADLHPEAHDRGEPRRALPLFDPLRRLTSKGRHRVVRAHAAPRILFPGVTEPFRLPPPPSPDDPVDAANLGRRLAALSAALDDLPGQARRFARWQALRARNRDAGAASSRFRHSPLRPGRPPGGRLFGYDPAAASRRRIRDVDEVLAHAHALALYALAHPDTS